MSMKLHRQIPACFDGYGHIYRRWDSTENMSVARILPGEFYVTKEDEQLITTLGSCVSACIRDRVFKIGGMNHFMLPESAEMQGQSGTDNLLSNAARYGSYAMEHLINGILRQGGLRKNLEIKVFGGGKIISTMTDVGVKNIRFVLEYLKTENLPISAQDLGDVYPRKVIYFPQSGRVRVKHLKNTNKDVIARQEQSYSQEINQTPVAGEVELF